MHADETPFYDRRRSFGFHGMEPATVAALLATRRAPRRRWPGRLVAVLLVLLSLGSLVKQARAADVVTYTAGPVNVCYDDIRGTGATVGQAFSALIAALNARLYNNCLNRPSPTGQFEANGVSAPIFSDGVYTATGSYIGSGDAYSGSTSIVGHCAEPCTGDPTAPAGGQLSWASTPHLLQALFVLGTVGLFFGGLKTGRTA